MFEMQFS